MIAAAAKSTLYRLGALAAYHGVRNRRSLTVLMFHRVLPPGEIERRGADPEWSMTTELFDGIVAFAKRHYHPVGLDEVAAARARRKPLPARALLLSFDDGWRDNLDHAAPILRRHGVPAVLFAASEAIEDGQPCWWQDVVFWALRSGGASLAELRRAAGPEPAAGAGELDLIVRLARLAPDRRDEVLAPFARELGRRQPARQMLDPPALRELAAAGVAVGVHGAAHLPLTALAEPAADLDAARAALQRHTGGAPAASLSFPHGRYDAKTVAAARRLGFSLQFTSEAALNPAPGGFLASDLLGRIPVFASQVADAGGRLSPARLAAALFLRPHRKQDP